MSDLNQKTFAQDLGSDNCHGSPASGLILERFFFGETRNEALF